jgi:RimJ/RimL family protein N-acetyltransferase
MRREAHFVKKGYFKRNSDGNPIWEDVYSYAILKEEWKRV